MRSLVPTFLPLCVLAIMALSCTSHTPEPLSIAPEAEPGAVEALLTRPFGESESEPEPEPLACLPEGFTVKPLTVPTLAEQAASGPCWTVPAKLQRRLTREVEDQWEPSEEGGTLQLSFACDRLGEIEELVYESGAGHGGSLELARLRRGGEARDWDALVIRRENMRRGSSDSGAVRVWRGTLSEAQVRDALDTARAAASMQLDERAPAQPGEGHGFFSSADVYSFVQLVDADGRGRARSFVGYLSGDAQAESIPTGRASGAIAELLDGATLDEAPVDADSRAFFMARYLDDEARLFGDEFAWWVRERMVELAAGHASADLIPALARQLCLDDDDASGARTRARAIMSIMALGEHEGALEIDVYEGVSDAVVGRWVEACGVACGSP